MTQNNRSGPVRLLVVDDEPIVGKRLRQAFGKMGFEVDIVTSGKPALELMEEKPFDVVITDLKMEGIDGMELLSRAKRLNPSTQVIIITGYAEQDTADQAFREGVFDFIAKPFRLEELKEAITRALACRPDNITNNGNNHA